MKPLAMAVVILAIANAQTEANEGPIVRTKLGAVRGNRYRILNTTVDVFWGVPFGKPPIGNLRFHHPEPALPWNGTLNCTTMPNACHQYYTSPIINITTKIAEDCLYLNIFAARSNDTKTNQTGLPVMFYLHGGGFFRGTSAVEYHNSTLLAAVLGGIVVTSNYRLGAFGFVYSGTEDAPGNAGLFDQLLALKWVHDNIASFGGDPNSVTIFGGSAGAVSVGTLMLTPLSANLFQKAILISGTPNIPSLFTSQNASIETVLNLARFAGCNTSRNQNDSIRCLKKLSEERLDAIQEKNRPANYQPIMAGPYFPQNINELYKNAIKRNISVLMGVTENDGFFFLPYRHGNYVKVKANVTLSSQQLLMILETEMNSVQKKLSPSQKLITFHTYINWEDPHNGVENLNIAGNFVTDTMFICPTNAFGKMLVEDESGPDVYVYMFTHQPSVSKWPSWAGAVHGDDLPFIFGHPFLQGNYTKDEKILSDRIMRHLTRFAKTGNPSLEDFQWPKYKKHSLGYVELNLQSPKLRKAPRARHCALWNVVIPKMFDMDCSAKDNAV